MRGKILGFTPSSGSGAISGENGERYTFVAGQWRSDRPITVGTSVDFAAVAEVATEIYPVASAMPGAADLATSPGVQKLRTLSMTTLAFPLAALLLLATFLPAITTPMSSASLWGIGSISKMMSANPLLANDDTAGVAEEIESLDKQAADLRTHTTGFGGMPLDNSAELASIAKAREVAEKSLSAARTAKVVSGLLIVRWTVPVLAILLLWFSWSGKELRTMTIAAGAASIVTAIIMYAYRQSLVGGMSPENSLGGMISRQMDAVISVGIGTYLIGLLGVGLILAALGIVRNPLATRAV